jgi:small-conductance mechanosensitive channel
MAVQEFLQTLFGTVIGFFKGVLTLQLATIAQILVLILLGYVIGKIFKAAVIKLLSVVGFKRITSRSWAESVLKVTGYRGTIVELIADLVKWLIYILFLALIIETLGLPGIAKLFTEFVGFMPRFIGAIMVVVIGFIIADFFGKIFEEAGRSFFGEELLSSLSGGLVKYSIAIVTVIMALSLIGLDPTSLTVMFALTLGTVIALVLIGVRDVFPNYSASLSLRKELKVGQRVKIGPYSGVVEEVKPMSVVLLNGDKRTTIPASFALKNPIEKRVKK